MEELTNRITVAGQTSTVHCLIEVFFTTITVWAIKVVCTLKTMTSMTSSLPEFLVKETATRSAITVAGCEDRKDK